MKILTASLNIILDSIITIENYTKWYDFEKFISDRKTFDATLMQLQHIWETTRKIVQNFWDISELPTSQMIWLRNFIAHEYLWISESIIWETVISDLPELKSKIINVIKNLN